MKITVLHRYTNSTIRTQNPNPEVGNKIETSKIVLLAPTVSIGSNQRKSICCKAPWHYCIKIYRVTVRSKNRYRLIFFKMFDLPGGTNWLEC